MKRMEATSPLFARAESSYMAGSVGCGHLNQWLCSVHAGRPCAALEFQDSNGCWDRVRMFSEDPHLEDYACNGLTWNTVHGDVEREYKHLHSIFERGLNTEHHIG